MKKLLLLMLVVITACTRRVKQITADGNGQGYVINHMSKGD